MLYIHACFLYVCKCVFVCVCVCVSVAFGSRFHLVVVARHSGLLMRN